MSDEKKRCLACNGRGYRRCGCWPGDCICGWDDEICEGCQGDGWVYPDDDWDDFFLDAMAAVAISKPMPHVGMAPRSRQVDPPKVDKRAKTKAARKQNVKRLRK